MSGKALGWARDTIRKSEIPTLSRFVLLLLADMADERWSCYPATATLVSETGASRRGVQLALRQLEDAGFLTTVAHAHQSGRQTSNRYYLNAASAPHVESVDNSSAQASGGANSVRGEGELSSGGGRSECAPGGEVSAPPDPPSESPIDPARARRDDDKTQLLKIAAACGGDITDAKRIRAEILARSAGPVRDELAYVLRAVGAEPHRYRPTPVPRRPPECWHGVPAGHACDRCPGGRSGRDVAATSARARVA